MTRFIAVLSLVSMCSICEQASAGIAVKCTSKDGTVYKIIEDERKVEIVAPDGRVETKVDAKFDLVIGETNPPSRMTYIDFDGEPWGQLGGGATPEKPKLRVGNKWHSCQALGE